MSADGGPVQCTARAAGRGADALVAAVVAAVVLVAGTWWASSGWWAAAAAGVVLALAGVLRILRYRWSRPGSESGTAPRDVAAVALLVAAVAVPMAVAVVAAVSGHPSAAQWLAWFADAELVAVAMGAAGVQASTTSCPPGPPRPAFKVAFGAVVAASVLSLLNVLVAPR